MRVELRVVRGPLHETAGGKTFVFEQPDIFIFGRALDAHCSLPSDGTISRHHFMLQMNPPDCVLTDLDSGNGTVVNGIRYGGRQSAPQGLAAKKPRPVKLRSGDTVTAGLTTFTVSIEHGLACERCGGPLPEREETVLVSVGGMMLCEECGRKEFARLPSDGRPRPGGAGPSGREVAPLVVSSLCCSRCGRDATGEVGLRALVSRRKGADVEYICAACRRSLRRDTHQGRASGTRDMSEAPLPPPVEGYEFLRLVGTGGQRAVYLARRAADGRQVAIKTLLPSVAVAAESATRFAREIETTRSIRHPNVVEVIEHGRAGPVFYFVMEYVDGTDADELTKSRKEPIPETEAVQITLQALDGLAYAHARKFVHRDLKPANILLQGDAPPWVVKVADFGLAKSFEMAGLSGITTDADVMGSICYMPKEQITHFRWLKPTADVFSMGASLYSMLTRKPVKRGLETAEDMPAAVRAITSEPAVPVRERRADVSPGLAQVIDASLAENEADRYPDAAAMKEAVLRALGV